MSLSPQFHEDRPEVLITALEAAGLAIIVGSDGGGGFEADHVPVVFDPTVGAKGALIGHLARTNTLAGGAGRRVLAILPGPNAYISPSWYPSKAETGRAVPTWNYAAVHVHGTLEITQDPGFLRALLDRLTARHEAGRPQPWTVSDAPEDFVAHQLTRIVGFRLVVERIEGRMKMSQNRPAGDRAGVSDGLRRQGHPAGVAVAEVMDRMAGRDG